MNLTSSTSTLVRTAATAALAIAVLGVAAAPGAQAVELKSAKKHHTVVSLKAPAPVTYPAKVHLTGKLSTAGHGAGKHRLAVYERANAHSSWHLLAHTSSNSSGSYAYNASVNRSEQFKVSFAGTKSLTASTSPVRSVAVHPKLKLTVPSSVDTGSFGQVSVTFAPARPGRTVTLQYFDGAAWHNYANAKLDARSTGTFDVFYPDTAGPVELRAVAAGSSDLAAGASAGYDVQVNTPPAPPTGDCTVAEDPTCDPGIPPGVPPGTGTDPGVPPGTGTNPF